MIRYCAALLSLLVLTACGSSAGGAAAPKPLELNVETGLAAGSSAPVKGEDLEVRFVGVIEDSRCPTDTSCVWAGEVKIRLAAKLGTQPPEEREVLEGRSMIVEPYRLTVTRVLPEPVSTQKTPPQDYRIMLIVAKITDEQS
jgi:hypothetical protein